MGAGFETMFVWLKVAHIVAVVAWMAGLFYLPRLFVYHELSEVGSETSELFKVMERRLLGAIMTPAAVAVWVFGVLSAWAGGFLFPVPRWLIVKVVLVLGLMLLHVVLARFVTEFRADRRGRGDRFFRIVNEVPTVFLVVIVILVVVQPDL
jgi:protoporphyrinogen IX oxidase